MERDHQFEIQYLLTLTIAVLAAITTDRVGGTVDVRIGYGLLFLIGLHVLLLTITYSLESTTEFEFRLSEIAKSISRGTLVTVTMGFCILFLHGIFYYLFSSTTQCIQNTLFVQTSRELPIDCHTATILIAYVLPVLITVTMGLGFTKKILEPFRALRDINIFVAPSKIRIFTTFDSTEPLFVKVENEGGSEQKFEINVNLPEDVIARQRGRETTDRYSVETTISEGGREAINLELKYTGTHRKSEVIEIEFKHEDATRSELVEVLLDPS